MMIAALRPQPGESMPYGKIADLIVTPLAVAALLAALAFAG
jgi:hypothetical protein